MKARQLTGPVLGFVASILVGCVTQEGAPRVPGGDDRVAADAEGCSTAPESTTNCFVIVLEPSQDDSEQPRSVQGAVGRGGRPPEVEQREMPATAGEPETILVAPDISEEHPDTHEHEDSAAAGTRHCHYWVNIRRVWYQLHC